jgi:hypothetical protein
MNAPLTVLPPLTQEEYNFPEVWDSTMVVAARKCIRYFRNAYSMHLRGRDTALPLHFGGCFAVGLEAYRQAYYKFKANDQLALEYAYIVMLNYWGDYPYVPTIRGEAERRRTFDRCVHALISYFEHWPIETDRLQPHMTADGPTFEYNFAVPLEGPRFPRLADGSPIIYTGRMDTLGSYDELPVFADEKTTVAMGASWAEQWRTRHQFIGYAWALRELGFKARSFIVRGICLGVNDVRFQETPPISISAALMAAFEEELAHTLWYVKRAFEHRTAPRNFGEGCYSYFRQCPYWESCSTKPEFSLGFLKTIERQKWDPLRVIEGTVVYFSHIVKWLAR